MSVAIPIPLLQNLRRFDGVLDWVVSKDNPYPVPDHRNVLAQYRVARERCISEGYDALLTVEHDMVLPNLGNKNYGCTE